MDNKHFALLNGVVVMYSQPQLIGYDGGPKDCTQVVHIRNYGLKGTNKGSTPGPTQGQSNGRYHIIQRHVENQFDVAEASQISKREICQNDSKAASSS